MTEENKPKQKLNIETREDQTYAQVVGALSEIFAQDRQDQYLYDCSFYPSADNTCTQVAILFKKPIDVQPKESKE